jgi:hypothetical protein
MFPSMKTELNRDRFKPHYRYENMNDAQIQFILKMILIDKAMSDIFIVLKNAVNIMIKVKKHSGGRFSYSDIDRRIKLAVIYNNFRHRLPNLYGNINRHVLQTQFLFSIFDSYVNDKGDEVYYVVFSCDTQKRAFEKYEQTDSPTIGREVTRRLTWNEEIDLDFVTNKVKNNGKLLQEIWRYINLGRKKNRIRFNVNA